MTTNPTILKRAGVKDIKSHIEKINTLVFPGIVSVEVTSNERKAMIAEAKKIYKEYKEPHNLNIKIPIHGPNGELDNLQVIKHLEDIAIPVNATAIMNAQQCLIAALAGASYVSIFGGRVANAGYDPCVEIEKTRKLFDRFRITSKIIVGSTREIINITDWLIAGADYVTTSPDLLNKMIISANTALVVHQFLEDAKDIGKTFIIPEAEVGT